MMPNSDERLILRQLPAWLRRSGPDSIAAQLSTAVGRKLEEMDRMTRSLLTSRSVDYAGDIRDLERLAWLYDIPSWSEETVDDYRQRLQLLIPVYLHGAYSPVQLLTLLAASYRGKLSNVVLPNPFGVSGRGVNDAYTTTGDIIGLALDASIGHTRAVAFTAAVIEAPLVMQQEQTVHPTAGGSSWTVVNADAAQGYNPVIGITAGDQPVVCPIVMQIDQGRLFLVNRTIPPNATVQLNLMTGKVRDSRGAPSGPGPVVNPDGSTPSLLAAAGAVLDSDPADRLPAADGTPLHLAYWREASPEQTSLPPLLFPGATNWRLLFPVSERGVPIQAVDRVPLSRLHTTMNDTGNRPIALRFQWQAERQYAGFTLAYRQEKQTDWFADPPEGAQLDWFRQQLERLRPAGVAYLDPAKTLL